MIIKKERGLSWKNYFERNILITKIYNTINQCDTIFALLAPLDRSRDKDRE